MIITEDEFLEWKQIEVTKELLKGLKKEREKIKEAVVHSAYENEERAKGIAQGIQDILEMDYTTFKEMLSND